jgi:hypothetical protein
MRFFCCAGIVRKFGSGKCDKVKDYWPTYYHAFFFVAQASSEKEIKLETDISTKMEIETETLIWSNVLRCVFCCCAGIVRKNLHPIVEKTLYQWDACTSFLFFVAQASLEKIEHLNGIAFGNR